VGVSPGKGTSVRAIILAAGVGWQPKTRAEAAPKCLLDIGGKTLLRRYLEALAALGISEAVLVVGLLKEQVIAEAATGPDAVRVRVVENDRYQRGSILSLWQARDEFDDDVLIMDAGLLYPQELLARLLATPDANAIAVDEQCQDTGEREKVVCEDGWVVEVSKKIAQDSRVRGEAVGIVRLSAEAAEILRGILEEFIETGKDSGEYEEAFRELAGEVPIGVVEVGDLPWVNIDSRDHLARAQDEILPNVDRLDRGEAVPAP
jgi:L-glutamine-phosphate cytidylyltransferase